MRSAGILVLFSIFAAAACFAGDVDQNAREMFLPMMGRWQLVKEGTGRHACSPMYSAGLSAVGNLFRVTVVKDYSQTDMNPSHLNLEIEQYLPKSQFSDGHWALAFDRAPFASVNQGKLSKVFWTVGQKITHQSTLRIEDNVLTLKHVLTISALLQGYSISTQMIRLIDDETLVYDYTIESYTNGKSETTPSSHCVFKRVNTDNQH